VNYSLSYSLSLLVHSVHRFGVLPGLRVAGQLLTGRKTFSIRLPGYSHPIWVRGGTSDVETFEKVFIREEYKHDPIGAEFIIDLGSNVGYSVLFFAQLYPNAQLYCVEPEASNFAMLKKNIQYCPNVMPFQAGVWSAKTRLVIADQAAEKWATQVRPAAADTEGAVESVTIPELLEKAGRSRIDLLKIDIESAEKELFLTGTDAWLGKVHVLIIELHDRILSGCSTSFYRATSRYHFDQYLSGENIFLMQKPAEEETRRAAA